MEIRGLPAGINLHYFLTFINTSIVRENEPKGLYLS